jgi:hypothetical protein
MSAGEGATRSTRKFSDGISRENYAGNNAGQYVAYVAALPGNPHERYTLATKKWRSFRTTEQGAIMSQILKLVG